jgi:hypothetical protein
MDVDTTPTAVGELVRSTTGQWMVRPPARAATRGGRGECWSARSRARAAGI